MEIQHSDDGKKGRFYVEIAGEKLAEMTYVWSSETKFIIDHTEVNDKLRGKNVGKQLVHAAVEFAREKNSKILPLCPFAKAIFNKIDEYKDVLV
jgi:uncharacterized protein